MSIDAANKTITLGSAPYYSLSFGVNVESFNGNPSIEMIQKGVGSEVNLPVRAAGGTSFDLIIPNTPGTTIQFKVLSGNITLIPHGGINAFLSVSGFTL